MMITNTDELEQEWRKSEPMHAEWLDSKRKLSFCEYFWNAEHRFQLWLSLNKLEQVNDDFYAVYKRHWKDGDKNKTIVLARNKKHHVLDLGFDENRGYAMLNNYFSKLTGLKT